MARGSSGAASAAQITNFDPRRQFVIVSTVHREAQSLKGWSVGNTKTGKVFRFPASCVLEPGRAIRVEVQQGDPEGASAKKADYVDSTSDGRGAEEVYYLLEYPYETPYFVLEYFLLAQYFALEYSLLTQYFVLEYFPTDSIFSTVISLLTPYFVLEYPY